MNELEQRVSDAVRTALSSAEDDLPACMGDLCRHKPCHCCDVVARAAIKAHAEWLESKGLVVVPKLATPIMTQAAADELNPYTNKEASYELSCEVALNSWQAMIAAAQQEDQHHD